MVTDYAKLLVIVTLKWFLPKEQQERITKRLKIIVSIQRRVWIEFHISKNLQFNERIIKKIKISESSGIDCLLL